ARYVPMLARAGAKVVLEVPPALKAPLARLDGVAAVIARRGALPPLDVQCPLRSLPPAMKTQPRMVPADIPYLEPDEQRVAAWRGRLESLAAPRVAIAWSGNPAHVNDRNRSVALERLAPLVANERLSFVSIQRDLRPGEAEALARMPRLT